MVGVAVKITLVPAQIVVAVAAILTDGITDAVTVIVIALDVTVAGLAHEIDDVISTVTTSPFTKVELWNVELLVPTLLPFSFHW